MRAESENGKKFGGPHSAPIATNKPGCRESVECTVATVHVTGGAYHDEQRGGAGEKEGSAANEERMRVAADDTGGV